MLKKRNTRKRSNKNNSYYDPRAAAGYEVLNNLAAFERLGTAMQSHDQNIAKQIDSESARYRRQNAKDIEWEDTVQKEKDEARQISEALKKNKKSILGGLAESSNVTGGTPQLDTLGADATAVSLRTGQTSGHIKNQDMPGQPKGYGLSDLFSDQWNSFFGEMNHLQAEDARGYQTRMQNDKALIKDYSDSLDKLDEIDSINFRLNEINQIPKGDLTKGQVESLTKEIRTLNARKSQLQKEYQALAPRRKMLEDIVNQSSLGAAFDNLVAGNGVYGGKNFLTDVIGTTTALHDEINDARRFLYDLGSGKRSRTETRMQLKRAIDEYDNLNKGWQAIIDENEADWKKHQDKVSSWYKGREEKASTDFFDPDTYLFKMPGIMGGSSSSYMKQIPGMVAGLAAGIVASPLVAGAGAGSMIGGIGTLGAGLGTSFAFNRGAGISENNAEVALAAVEKIRQRTDLSEKDIKDLLAGKLTDQAKLRQITENIGNVENLFNADMAATTWDAAVDAALNTMPIGALARIGKFAKGTKIAGKIMSNPVMKRAAESRLGRVFANDFRGAYRTLDATSPLGGAVAGLTNATVIRGAKEGTKALGNFVMRRAEGTAAGKLANNLWKRTEMLSKAMQKLSPTELARRASLRNGTRIQYGKSFTGRVIKSAIAEGIEEGKQYVNAEAFKNGTLDPEYMGVMDVAFTDMVNGLKMGAYVLGIPADGLGLVDIKDKQLLAEIKGGMLGGWGHTATINTIQSAVPYIREQRANDIVLQQIYADKMASQADFKQYTNWLKKGLFNPGYSEVLNSFERMREINENDKQTSGTYGIEPSLIDEAERKYKTVIGIANSPITKIEAKNAGVQMRTLTNPQSWRSNKEYHEFVAAKAIALDHIREIEQRAKDAKNDVAKAEASQEQRQFSDRDNEQLEEVLNILQGRNENDALGEQYGETEVELDENGNVVAVGKKQNPLEVAMSAHTMENANSTEMTRNIARLAALLQYREYIEKGLELQKNNPNARVRHGIKEQLDRVNKLIDFYKLIDKQILAVAGQDINTLSDVENLLVFDKESHDELKDAYLEQLKWDFELESANKAYTNLVGKHQRIDENGKARDLTQDDVDNWKPTEDLEHFTTTKGNAKKIIEDIHNMEKDDDDFESLIETVYQDDLKAEHLDEQNAYETPSVRPYRYRPVLDANNEQVRVQFDDLGRINRRLSENEHVTPDGLLWEDMAFGRKDPVLEALKPRMSRQEASALERRMFIESFNKQTGETLPMTPEGLIERRKLELARKITLSPIVPPTPSGYGQYVQSYYNSRNKLVPPPSSPPPFNYGQYVQSYYDTRNRLVPPPPTPPTPPVVEIGPEKTPQEETIAMLQSKYESDKTKVLRDPNGYHTTSQDYFVMVDGKVTRMSRMHNVMPESYEHKDRDEFIKGSVENLQEAESYEDIEEIIVGTLEQIYGNVPVPQLRNPKTGDIVNVALGMLTDIDDGYEDVKTWWQQNAPDMLVYLRYLNDNRNIFFENPSAETELEKQRTLENLAKAFYETTYRKEKGNAIKMGNVVDEFGRNFFGTEAWYALSSTEEGVEQLFNSVNEADGRTYSQLFDGNIDAFKTFINQARERYDYYTNKLGWTLIALPITWRANFKNTGWVAGETDLIGVDEDGGIHIIDFKTSKNSFEPVIIPDVNLSNKLNKKVVRKSFPFMSLPNQQYGQVISAYDDYSNQQTGYAQMIQFETGGNVASIEIMPFWCSYDYRNFDKVNSINLQRRTMLMFSSKMLDILNGVMQQTDPVVEELRKNLNDAYNELLRRRADLSEKMTDEVWNTLSDNAKLVLGDFMNWINNIQIPENDDVDLLNSVLKGIDRLLNEYDQMLQFLREDYQYQKDLEARRAEFEARRRQREQHEQQEDSADGIYANNKRDSKGNRSHANLHYKDVEKYVDLEAATVAPDFITSADFSLYTEGSRVFVDISYGGKTWKHIEIDTQYYDMRERHAFPIPAGQQLLAEIKRLESSKKPGQRIVPVRATMSRTDGRVVKTSDGSYLPISKTNLFANEDIYDIEFSFNYGKLGFVDNSGQLVTFDISSKDKKPIYSWERPSDIPADGTLMYLLPVRKDETNQTKYVPVAIDRVKLTEGDARFILNLLQHPNLLDGEYYVEQDGNVYKTHTTGRNLASMMIPIVDNPTGLQLYGNAMSILRNPANPNIVWIINRENYSKGYVGRGQFDISTQVGVENFIKELQTMSIEERRDVMMSRLGEDTNPELPFAGIRRMFVENNSNSNKLDSIKITDTLSFSVDDFKTTTSKNGVVRNGVNGFAFYLKHGMLNTQYVRLGHSNVEIKNAMLEDDSEPEVQANGIPEAPSAEQVTEQVDDDIDAFLLKQYTYAKRPKKLMTEEKAKRHIQEILGDVQVDFVDDFIKVLSGAAHVVGCCKADSIAISSYATPRVEYHEAFHRIFETLIPESKRVKIQKQIAERLGLTLYNEDGTENKDAFREVAEYVADRYMDHMQYHFTDIKIPILSKAFNRVHDWAAQFVHYSDRDLYKIFIEVNKGKYKNAKPSKRAIDRFNRLYGKLYATIHGVNFKYIANPAMYDEIRKSVLFCITQGFPVDSSGRNIQEIGKHINKETFKLGIEKLAKLGYDILGEKATVPTIGQLAMREMYENFNIDEIRDDIANDLSIISTDYQKIAEEESIEDAQSGDVVGASIGEHTRASYEFSRFDKTSSRVRFFFATIPDTVYKDITVMEDGKPVVKKVPTLALNEFGLPKYVPVNSVFNEVLNLFHDIDTIDELKERLQYFAKEGSIYDTIYRKLFGKNGVYTKTYKVVNGQVVRNSDNEALLSQLMNVIRSNRHNFDIVRSETRNGAYGSYTIIIQPSGMDYNASFYPTQWNEMLVNGGTPILKIAADGSLYFNTSPDIFKRIADIFDHAATIKTAENGAQYNDVGIKQWLNNAFIKDKKQLYLRLNVGGKWGYYTDPNDSAQLDVVKDKIIQALNLVGVQFNIQELNYMLMHKYGSTGADALLRMFNSTAIEDSMTSFLQFLRNASVNGKPITEYRIKGKTVSLRNVYSRFAFLRDLANWKYQYRHAHDQLTVLATGNNKFYEISDNNYVSDVVRLLNKRSDEFNELTSGRDPYVYFKHYIEVLNKNVAMGSLILQELATNKDAFLTMRNFIGFKTDKRNDTGSDYFEISKREDYVSKAAILEKGGIIMPTLSDKKTYMYIDGIQLPGLNYKNTIDENGNALPFSTVGDQFVISADPTSQLENMLSQDPKVIDRFIQYAITEYESVKKADADLDQMEKDGTKNKDVDNYYKNEQGARFSSLIGVWEYDYKKQKDGSMQVVGETFHSFNNKNKTRKQNIQEAEKYFFNRSREEQEMLIARLLHKILLKEIDTCVELGLIEKVNNYDNIFQNYKNVGLNSTAIEIIYKSLVAKNSTTGLLPDVITENKYKSLATIIYINDISNKAIMSGQEVERVFSGNPAFYKWKFDKDGNLVDRTVDELKRLGGMVSTGNNNFLELKDIPAKYLDENGKFTGEYVCAQVDDELIESPQAPLLKELMYRGELTTAAYLKIEEERISEFRKSLQEIEKLLRNPDTRNSVTEEDKYIFSNRYEREQSIRREISKEIDQMTNDQLKQLLDPATFAIVERKAKEASDSYIGDINVADGAAYITDTMAEMLLRMNGNYSAAIEKAFKILREEIPSTILEKQSVYKDVVTAVIGSQKYTAFGRRTHAQTGIQVNYYNKMALFPLFKCMATGKTQNIYNKMMEQGIDMLMMSSAVKVGGQGSKSIDWNAYSQEEGDGKPEFSTSFNFDTYSQKFMYLRKQLNTDPKEESMMGIGTQMTKIAMVNLLDGRDYYTRDGSVMSGVELRNDIMNAINVLSDRGMNAINSRFFKTDKDGNLINSDGEVIDENNPNQTNKQKVLDEKKFSKEVRKLLLTKDPDKNVLSAIELVEQVDPDGVTRKHMRLPLNAISNSKWLESILISAVNKEVIDIKTTGDAFIQRSIWGMEGSAMLERKNGQIIGDDQLPKTINNGERLKMINEEGSMDCVVSVDFIKKMFKGDLPRVPIKDKNRNVIWDKVPELDRQGNAKKDDKGNIIYAQKKDKEGNPMFDAKGNPVYKRRIRTREMTFDELRSWLINRGIIGKNAKSNIVAYRIPTQAQSSIHALRIVDVIPVVNDTVILPAEFTKITGSDFDIDKLFLSAIQYKVNREEGEDGKYHQTVTSQFDESTNAYYQNKLIEDYITLALDWKSQEDHSPRSANILHRSIDNDTELLKSIIRGLEENKPSTKEAPYSFYSLSAQTEAKNDYITGKVGIGPFALNNNNHVLTMMYHVRFKHIESSIMAELGLENLDNHQDRDGESVMSWLSALINAHVDIAKDPYISRLNVNPFTYNLVNLLIRTGLGKKTFYFTTQPIMRELAKAYMNAGSMYMSDPYSTKYALQEEAIDTVAKEWFENVSILGKTSEELINAVKSGGIQNTDIRSKINIEIHKLFESSLIQDAKSDDVNMEHQLLYYLAYLQFSNYANAMSSLVTYSKIDTKKHGKSVTEQLVYEHGFNNVYDFGRESNLFEEQGLYHMLNDSYIGNKTRNAINSVKDILSGQFIESSPAFLGTVDQILKAIGRGESLSASLVEKVSRALSAAVKAQFFNEEYIPSITDDPNYTRNLVTGDNTIYDRFAKLQVAIYSDPNYRELLNSQGEIENKLLQMLVPGKVVEYKPSYIPGEMPDTYMNLEFVKFFNFVEDSGNTANYIIDAWDELLNYTSSNKEVEKTIREFARDLIVYGFITSGDRGGFTKIFKYVPASWRESSGYGNFLRRKLIEYQISDKTDIDINDVILNNWFDNELVRTYKEKDKNNVPNFMQYRTKINGVPCGFPTVLAAIKKKEDGFVASIDPNNAPLFIKIKRRKDRFSYDSQRKFTIYKLHNIALSNNNVAYPVYVKVNPKGNQVSGNFLITEYGRSDALWSEYSINEDVMKQIYTASNLSEYLQLWKMAEPVYVSIMAGLNRAWNRQEEKETAINGVLNRPIRQGQPGVKNDTTSLQFFDDNTMQNIYQNWEYMEDSGDSTPRTDIKSEKYIAKSILGVEMDESTGARMYDFVKGLGQVWDDDSEDDDIKITIKYAEYKYIASKIDRLNAIRDMLIEEFGIDNDNVYGKYNKKDKTISFSKYIYDFYKLISQNQDLLDFINSILNKANIFEYVVTDEDSILYLLENGLNVFDGNIGKKVENYSQLDVFQDTAEQDVYDDSEFSDEAMNHCKT